MYQLPEIPVKKKPRPKYRKPEAVRQLEALADEEAGRRHPAVDKRYLAPRQFRDDSANDLTKCIVAYITLRGGFASRINTTGVYRAKLNRYTPTGQKKGIADIIATFRGLALQIEVKFGRDRQSSEQQAVEQAHRQAGGLYYLARDFTSFKQWFDAI
ncbi:hypothetical protein EG830_14880 [bacterium]|nr:hypothetical protein [bacterium]